MNTKIRSSVKSLIGFSVATALATSAYAALTFTIPAPNGVGDVVALTNALAQINAAPADGNPNGRFWSKVWLEPGIYNLSGVYMNADSHLYVNSWHGGVLAGLGDGPRDVILIGGGESEAHRVLNGGGSNYDWLTISNLTVTGGWTTGNGGGIQGAGTVRYIDLVVSNNYAKGSWGAGGGGILRGHAINCLFADNRTDCWGGGFWSDGGGGQIKAFVQGTWNCVFTNNLAYYGGGQFGAGKCIDGTFIGNRAVHGGAFACNSGAAFTWHGDRFTNETEITGCIFTGNRHTQSGHGTAIHNLSANSRPLISVSNCVMTANIDDYGGNGVVNGCDMTDCTFTGNTRPSCLIYNCNLTRCLVADNTRTTGGDTFDNNDSAGTYTNVNCLFIRNADRAYGNLTIGKVLVNCTYAENTNSGGGNYGGFIRKCPSWNCLFAGNTIGGNRRDIRYEYLGFTFDLALTNCVITATYNDVSETFPGLANCRITKQIKVADEANGNYTPTTGSPLYDKAAQDAWILSLVGDRDLAGNRRVFGDRLDIGAFECQAYPPALKIIVK